MNHDITLVIIGGALVTYATRFPFLAFSGLKNIPPPVAKYLSFMAPAVLTALIVPAVLVKQGRIDFTLNNDYGLAALMSILAAYFYKNTFIVVIAGILSVGLLVYLR